MPSVRIKPHGSIAERVRRRRGFSAKRRLNSAGDLRSLRRTGAVRFGIMRKRQRLDKKFAFMARQFPGRDAQYLAYTLRPVFLKPSNTSR